MLVADIGNSRIKWGVCENDAIVRVASLSPEDPDNWRDQLSAWNCASPQQWTIAGVHPKRRDRLADWLRQRGDEVRVITRFDELPLQVNVAKPFTVGIDRLLNVLAAKRRIPAGRPAIVVDAGSAITVNLLDETGGFGGGAIMPGMRLMAESLHTWTAALPLVDPRSEAAAVPAETTPTAISAGIHWAAIGGIRALVREIGLMLPAEVPLPLFVTGGDMPHLVHDLPPIDGFDIKHVPELTLDGLRLAAQAAS